MKIIDINKFLEKGVEDYKINLIFELVESTKKIDNMLTEARLFNDGQKKIVDLIDIKVEKFKGAELNSVYFDDGKIQFKIEKFVFLNDQSVLSFNNMYKQFDDEINKMKIYLSENLRCFYESRETILNNKKNTSLGGLITLEDIEMKANNESNSVETSIEGEVISNKKIKNKGITKKIREIISEHNYKRSDKSVDEICDEICGKLKVEGFDPDWHSVYVILNREDINNQQQKIKNSL